MSMEIMTAALGFGGMLLQGRSQKRAIAAAEARARKIREFYETQARKTERVLGQEIQTMKNLRSLDMPAFQQAASIAEIQRRKGMERAARASQVGRLPGEISEALFGGNLEQYLGREQQKFQRYERMSTAIYSAAAQAQAEVNKLYQAGGSDYSSRLGEVSELQYKAGDPLGKALGAAASGMSLAKGGEEPPEGDGEKNGSLSWEDGLLAILDRYFRGQER